MKKTAIVYASVHHQNTKTLLTEMVKEVDVDLFTVTQAEQTDFSQYEIIGFGSGVYAGRFHRTVFRFLKEHKNRLPKKAFAVCTSGMGTGRYVKKFSDYLQRNGFEVFEGFECKGFDTFAFFKWFGGLAKGHPDSQDIENGKNFIKKLLSSC